MSNKIQPCSHLSVQTFKKKWEHNTIFFYYSSVCFICKLYDKSKLKRCGGCKLIAYCSIDHQKMNWTRHKPFCTIVKQLLGKTGKMHLFQISQQLTLPEFNCFKLGLKHKLETDLGRGLTPVEQSVCMFPRICLICFNTDQNALIDCENCLSITYCSEKHLLQDKDFHKTKCEALKLNFQFNSIFFNEVTLVKNDTFNVQTNQEYLSHLPNDLATFAALYTNLTLNFVKLELAEELSLALTIIHVLEKLEIVQKRLLKSNNEFCIHIIGASIKEVTLNWSYILIILSKWILNLTVLDIFCIGPECIDPEFDLPNCCEQNISTSVHFYPMLYHDFLNMANMKKSSINFAFNCGFHEHEKNSNCCTWRLSLPLMVNVPLAFTSYTQEEAFEDMNMIKKYADCLKLDVVLNCLKNAYSGLKPIRDWEQYQDCFYTNNYISVIRPK